jgi:hypothetical protein
MSSSLIRRSSSSVPRSPAKKGDRELKILPTSFIVEQEEKYILYGGCLYFDLNVSGCDGSIRTCGSAVEPGA